MNWFIKIFFLSFFIKMNTGASDICELDPKSVNDTVERCDLKTPTGCLKSKVCVYQESSKSRVCCTNAPKLTKIFKKILTPKEIHNYRILVDHRSYQPVTCLTQIEDTLYNNCPPGYICVIIPLLSTSYCCYQPQQQSYCPRGNPYYPPGKNTPQRCNPAINWGCPCGHTCQTSPYYNYPICCGYPCTG